MTQALQDEYAFANTCFGCGPSNPNGLQIKSHVEGDTVVARWRAAEYHEAFEGVLCGGIIGTLLDCHSNWTAAYHLMRASGATKVPCTVTAEFSVKLRRPTPSSEEIVLRARPTAVEGDRANVEATLEAGGKVCATFEGVFVAVKPGHPAYHRW